MRGTSELKCVMSPEDWALTALGAVLLVGCAIMLVAADATGFEVVLFVLGCLVGLALLGWVATGRRVMLRADVVGLTYQGRRRADTILWKNLSSVQFSSAGRRGPVREMIVVNDMGRKQMHIRVQTFDRRALHDFLEPLPARVSGLETLLE